MLLYNVEEITYLFEDHFLTEGADAIAAWGGVSVRANTHTDFRLSSNDDKYC